MSIIPAVVQVARYSLDSHAAVVFRATGVARWTYMTKSASRHRADAVVPADIVAADALTAALDSLARPLGRGLLLCEALQSALSISILTPTLTQA